MNGVHANTGYSFAYARIVYTKHGLFVRIRTNSVLGNTGYSFAYLNGTWLNGILNGPMIFWMELIRSSSASSSMVFWMVYHKYVCLIFWTTFKHRQEDKRWSWRERCEAICMALLWRPCCFWRTTTTSALFSAKNILYKIIFQHTHVTLTTTRLWLVVNFLAHSSVIGCYFFGTVTCLNIIAVNCCTLWLHYFFHPTRYNVTIKRCAYTKNSILVTMYRRVTVHVVEFWLVVTFWHAHVTQVSTRELVNSYIRRPFFELVIIHLYSYLWTYLWPTMLREPVIHTPKPPGAPSPTAWDDRGVDPHPSVWGGVSPVGTTAETNPSHVATAPDGVRVVSLCQWHISISMFSC